MERHYVWKWLALGSTFIPSDFRSSVFSSKWKHDDMMTCKHEAHHPQWRSRVHWSTEHWLKNRSIVEEQRSPIDDSMFAHYPRNTWKDFHSTNLKRAEIRVFRESDVCVTWWQKLVHPSVLFVFFSSEGPLETSREQEEMMSAGKFFMLLTFQSRFRWSNRLFENYFAFPFHLL